MLTTAKQSAKGGGRARANRRMARLRFGWLALAVGALVAAPFVIYPQFLMAVLCFALFASAFNLLLGYTGLLSFGHAAFFGGAAYVTAHTVKEWGVSPEIGILLGVASAAVLGLLIGALAIRRQGIYFSMITLALSQLFFFFCHSAKFTKGEDGIQAVPSGHLFGLIDLHNQFAMYFFVLAVFLVGLSLIWRFVNSPFGMVLTAIKDNEARAISLGYSISRYKLTAFVMSAAMAGLAGATKTLVYQFATLTDVTWQMSGEVILMTLIGGIGTLTGPFFGAAVITTLRTYLAATAFPVTIVTGLVFMVCVLIFRRGIVGTFRASRFAGWLGFPRM